MLPDEVLEVFRDFRTAELATIARDGVPLAVPLSPLWQPAHERFLVTTGIGLPYKAYHARRNPRVSLLFSTPTGSGLDEPPAVLVQGEAAVSDLTTWDEDLAEFWPWIFSRQPAGASKLTHPFYRYVIPWYYQRLKIYVVPRRVRWWRHLDMLADPAGSTAELPADRAATPPATERPNAAVFARVVRAAHGFPTVRLTVIDDSGYPASTLCRATPDQERRGLRVQVPAWLNAAPGPASVMSHHHDEQLWKVAGFLSRGTLRHTDDGQWLFAPTGFTTVGASGPMDTVRFIRSSRRAARAYLSRMQSPPPPIPWEKISAAKKGARCVPSRSSS